MRATKERASLNEGNSTSCSRSGGQPHATLGPCPMGIPQTPPPAHQHPVVCLGEGDNAVLHSDPVPARLLDADVSNVGEVTEVLSALRDTTSTDSTFPPSSHHPAQFHPHLGATAAPGDAAFTSHMDGDVRGRASSAHKEALLCPALLQPLQVQQVLELQAAPVRLAAPELPQGFAEAVPDALAGEEAVLLNLAPQGRWDAGLVAAGMGW